MCVYVDCAIVYLSPVSARRCWVGGHWAGMWKMDDGPARDDGRPTVPSCLLACLVLLLDSNVTEGGLVDAFALIALIPSLF